jgi:CRISPR system Cascade subunit CasD
MPTYLTFALVAPIASFGGIAVGERRSGWDRPARSAVLGLIGACLGLEREDDAAQAALAEDYALALLCHAPGQLLADYHTAQVPSAQRGRRFSTRAQEVNFPSHKLNTILSRRDYRSDAWHLAALWPREATQRWSLEAVAEAMRRPGFVPYLGRKSCPLGLPLAPALAEATDAPAALAARHKAGVETAFRNRWLNLRTPLPPPTVTVDAADAGDIALDDPRRRHVEFRRDQPRSRRRWQFDLREELVLQLDPL